jgi:ribonuclease Z
MLEVALAGTGGMMPLPNRFLSALLCRVNGSMILFDCGEGTQVTLKMLGWGFKQIDHLCFTHFHADHISGLPGLLLTIGNANRNEPLNIYGPAGLAQIVKSLCVIAPELPFPIVYNEWKTRQEYNVTLTNDLTLSAHPADHGASCFAYAVELKRRGRFDPARAKAADIPLQIWSALQKQNDADIVYNGKRYTSDMVLGQPRKGLKITYCTDTRPTEGLAGFAFGSELFICEGLYGEADKWEKTAKHKHMTYAEAAALAVKAEAHELWLTHFSPAMPDPKYYLKMATDVFPKTVVGRDRMTKTLRFPEDEEDMKR